MSLVTTPCIDLPPHVQTRLRQIGRETGDHELLLVSRAQGEDTKDRISTALMNTYQRTEHQAAFDLLVELNRDSLLGAVRHKLRGCTRVDAEDVLQEALLNICRYRMSFRGDASGAFRRWSHRIANNAACKVFRAELKHAIPSIEETTELDSAVAGGRPPWRVSSDAERAEHANTAFLIFLSLYHLEFQKLSARERAALALVELVGKTYRETAATLGVRMASMKMLIFRSRRKILRGITRSLATTTRREPTLLLSIG